MPTSEAQAPVLSTPQSDEAFTYAKVNKAEIKRDHLGLGPGDDYSARIHDYYSLSELAQFLDRRAPENPEKRIYEKVALQFPDALICDSAAIVQRLQAMLPEKGDGLEKEQEETSDSTQLNTENPAAASQQSTEKPADSCCTKSQDSQTNCCGSPNGPKECTSSDPHARQRIWILADTSYSACCVDEVAAEHVGANLVVHFGDACLNPVASINAAYVFGKPQLDFVDLEARFRQRFPDPTAQTVVLMADAPHTYLLEQVAGLLPEYRIVVADLHVQNEVTCIGYQPKTSGKAAVGRLLREGEAEKEHEIDLSQCDLFHVTVPEAPRFLQLCTQFQSVSTYVHGNVSQGPFPNIMRRYRYMHMARAAGTIGILVNTLSLANTKRVITELAKKIKEAGKKHYLFVVGKPNVAKLANFDAVDLWCVLGCDHQGILLDQNNEYFKPIVTPYELLLAIGDEFSWTGKWVTDFESVLKLTEEETEEKPQDDDASDEEPEFDPVTGRFVNARPLRRINHLQITQEEENPQALVQKLSGTVALKNTVSTSAAHLRSREWTGLGSDWGADQLGEDGADIEEGDAGIARGYSFDTRAENH